MIEQQNIDERGVTVPNSSPIDTPTTFTTEDIEAAIDRVVSAHPFPYKEAVALTELKKELGMCLHENYAFNGGVCPTCGKVFPGEYI